MGFQSPSHAAHELVLFATNDGSLYRQHAVPLIGKVAIARRGALTAHTIERWELAGWDAFATLAAKKYAREFALERDWFKLFPLAIRLTAAADLRAHYEEQITERTGS